MDVKEALKVIGGLGGEDMSNPVALAGTVLAGKVKAMFKLLLECRDALPAISMVSARLRGLDLNLDKRIEDCIEPWRLPDETEGKHG